VTRRRRQAGIIELILTCLLSAETTPDAGCGSWRKQLESSRAASSERGVTSERQTAEWVSAERETLRERAASEHARRTELTRSTNERTNERLSLTHSATLSQSHFTLIALRNAATDFSSSNQQFHHHHHHHHPLLRQRGST